jgi:hypothetical protein
MSSPVSPADTSTTGPSTFETTSNQARVSTCAGRVSGQALYDAQVPATTRRKDGGHQSRSSRGHRAREMPNWFCLLGAVAEPGPTPGWSDLVATEIGSRP